MLIAPYKVHPLWYTPILPLPGRNFYHRGTDRHPHVYAQQTCQCFGRLHHLPPPNAQRGAGYLRSAGIHGKSQRNAGRTGSLFRTINNFCINLNGNWPRCTSCHIGYGWEDANFDFNDMSKIDRLVCHDTTGKYKKAPPAARFAVKKPGPGCHCPKCGNCVTACPYGARYRNPALRITDKCDFCEHRLKRGEKPACVATCATRARTFGDIHDPAIEVSRMIKGEKLVRVNAPHVNTQPNIYYCEGTRLLWTGPLRPPFPEMFIWIGSSGKNQGSYPTCPD